MKGQPNLISFNSDWKQCSDSLTQRRHINNKVRYSFKTQTCIHFSLCAVIYLLPSRSNTGICMRKTTMTMTTTTTTKSTYRISCQFESWLCRASRFHLKQSYKAKRKHKNPKWTNIGHTHTHHTHERSNTYSTVFHSSTRYIGFCVFTSRECSNCLTVHTYVSERERTRERYYVLTDGFLYGECEYFILF